MQRQSRIEVAAIVAVCVALATAALRAQATETLSDVESLKVALHRAKVDLAQLRAAVADRDARLASCELSGERAAIEDALRLTHPTKRINWETGLLVEPSDPPTR